MEKIFLHAQQIAEAERAAHLKTITAGMVECTLETRYDPQTRQMMFQDIRDAAKKDVMPSRVHDQRILNGMVRGKDLIRQEWYSVQQVWVTPKVFEQITNSKPMTVAQKIEQAQKDYDALASKERSYTAQHNKDGSWLAHQAQLAKERLDALKAEAAQEQPQPQKPTRPNLDTARNPQAAANEYAIACAKAGYLEGFVWGMGYERRFLENRACDVAIGNSNGYYVYLTSGATKGMAEKTISRMSAYLEKYFPGYIAKIEEPEDQRLAREVAMLHGKKPRGVHFDRWTVHVFNPAEVAP